MTIREKQALARRTFVRGMGAAMALPVLDVMGSAGRAEAMGQANVGTPRIPESVIQQQRLPDSIIEGFRKLQSDVASICDVLVQLGLSNCIYQGVKPLVQNQTMCGSARTIRLIPLQDPKNAKLEEQHPGSLINDSKPGDIIVIDQGGQVDKTIWGGHTATAAKEYKIGGVLIDGSCRDSLEILETGVPHFVKSTTPQHAHGIWRSTNFMSEPVQIGSTSVAPNDLVIGNYDGIVVIPRARAAEILKLATAHHNRDLEGFTAIRGGKLPWAPPPR